MIAITTGSYSALAKEGSLSAPWTSGHPTDTVEQVAVASDPTNGPLIAITTGGGQVLVREGSLSGPWTNEYAAGNVTQVVVAG